MTDRLDFEAGLEQRLRARAALADRPFDAAAIAHRVVGADVRRPVFGRLAWPFARPAFVVVILALLLAALGAVIVGALHTSPPPISQLPGNGWIAVSANPNGVDGGQVGDIYRVDAGARPLRIIGAPLDGIAQACPRFSPDGRRLVYGEARASDLPVTTFRGNWPVPDRALVVVGVNDQGDVSAPLLRTALSADAGDMLCPEWSPDGTALAVRVGAELWIMDATSGATTKVPTSEGPRPQNELEWSRDGRRIAVAEGSQVRVIRVADGTWEMFPVVGGVPSSLGWTAGDRQLVYAAVDVSSGLNALRLLDLGTMQDTKLTVDPTDPGLLLSVADAVVSPNGSRLAYFAKFTRCANDICVGVSPHVLTMDVDGAHVVDVPNPFDFRLAGLQWSPDGTRLLMGSISGVIAVAAVPGSPAVVYTSGELNLEWSGSQVTWQPLPR